MNGWSIKIYVLPGITNITYLPPSSVTIAGRGTPGGNVALETSTNLVNWTFHTNLTPNGSGMFQFSENPLPALLIVPIARVRPTTTRKAIPRPQRR